MIIDIRVSSVLYFDGNVRVAALKFQISLSFPTACFQSMNLIVGCWFLFTFCVTC